MTVVDSARGWASMPAPQRTGLSYVRQDGGPDYGSTAIADMWWPPAPMALPAEVCEHVIDHARNRGRPISHDASPPGAPSTRDGVTAFVIGVHHEPGTARAVALEAMVTEPVDADAMAAVVDRLKAANERWWTLELDTFTVVAKRYVEDGGHPAHADWVPDARSQSRKLSSSFQLSAPDAYEGGTLSVRRSNGPDFVALPVPRDRGTVAVFPSWTIHEVAPVTAGERWVLLVNGWGPRLR